MSGIKRNVVTSAPTTLQEGHEVFYNNNGTYTHYIGNSSNKPVPAKGYDFICLEIEYVYETSFSARVIDTSISGVSLDSNDAFGIEISGFSFSSNDDISSPDKHKVIFDPDSENIVFTKITGSTENNIITLQFVSPSTLLPVMYNNENSSPYLIFEIRIYNA
jgi:hypothetical protein